MEPSAMMHRATPPWAFALNTNSLEVTVRTKRGDVESVAARHGDRYAPSEQDAETPLALEGTDALFDYWRGVLPAPKSRPRYAFRIEGRCETGGETLWLGERGAHRSPERAGNFQVPYLHASTLFQPPAWLEDAVFYQVFPDRFRNGNPSINPPNVSPWGTPPKFDTVCGGDIAGIRQSIGYLRELGVTALYSTPLFASPSNHKYDTTDYENVDLAFGTNDDLIALSGDLHAVGMRLVLDGVFNHCGAAWQPFQDVRAHGMRDSHMRWFNHLEFPVDTDAVNYETFANSIASMPKLNPDDRGLREYLLAVAGRWTGEAALDGWRLDVGNEVSAPFWRAFRERVRTVNPEAFLLVESWVDTLDLLRGDTFDSTTNYPWRDAVLGFVQGRSTGAELLEDLTRVRMMYPSVVTHAAVNLLGSHDTARIRTEAGSAARAVMAAALLFTSPGVPLVYYGDEVGLEGGNDPDCRRCFPWNDANARDASIEAAYCALIALRRAHPWLRTCRWTPAPKPLPTQPLIPAKARTGNAWTCFSTVAIPPS